MKTFYGFFVVVLLFAGCILLSSFTSEKSDKGSTVLAADIELKGADSCLVGVPVLYSVPSGYRADENSWNASGVSYTLDHASDMGFSFTAHSAGWLTIKAEGYGPEGRVTFSKRVQVVNQ